MSYLLSVNEIGIELNFNFADKDNHLINFNTRHSCALAQVEIIYYLIKNLYPDQRFEILSLPPQNGSYKDWTIIKFLNENSGIASLIGAIIPIMLFSSQVKVNKTTADLNTLEIIEKCKSYNLSDEQVQKVSNICNSYIPKKQKNIFYQSVLYDSEIVSIEPKITNSESSTFTKEIKKEDFNEYIEAIPKEKEFIKINLSGNIQLSQPFIDKQQQYGRGVAWKGTYYGLDVFDEDENIIIEDGENIYFYMQDDEYKKQIINQEIAFRSGDNIGVLFDISRYYDFVNNKYSKPRLYIKKVLSHNDNLVQHKKELEKKKNLQKHKEKYKNQGTLFDYD